MFLHAAYDRVPDRDPLSAAAQFLDLKQKAMIFAARQIRQVLAIRAATMTVSLEGKEAAVFGRGLTALRPRSDEFRLYVFLDLFLFESMAVRDALAQLVNVAFQLRLPAEEAKPETVNARIEKLIAPRKDTGLRPWVTLISQPGSWLWTVNDLRNHATHRRLIRVHERFTLEIGGPMAAQGVIQGHTVIPTESDQIEFLEDFVNRMERAIWDLAGESLTRLTDILRSKS